MKNAGIETMEELCRMTDAEILRIRGISPVIAGDLRRIIDDWEKEIIVQLAEKVVQETGRGSGGK